MYAASGVATGIYTVTVTSTTQFTITTVATTALSAVAITFNFVSITGSGNVNSVAKLGTGQYYVNFTTVMPDANYACQLTHGGSSNGFSKVGTSGLTTGNAFVQTFDTGGTAQDKTNISVCVFR